MESARVIIEVVAGIIPGTPEPEFTRRWGITGPEWTAMDADARGKRMYELLDEAKKYADSITNPNRLNWVQQTWLWL